MQAVDELVQPLPWDSNLLGIAVAKILADSFSREKLTQCLMQCREQNIKLVYWCISNTDQEAIAAAKQANGILVDHKITYLIDLNRLNKSALYISDIEIYTDALPTEELIQLAFESGNYSRFRNDPNLSEDQFKAIYRAWMINSTNHTVATDVLIIKQQQNIVGMVTVGDKNQRGDIGLLAVSEAARGQQLGTRLVQAAQAYFINKKYTQSQVVTQQANYPACKLYEKLGYAIEKIEHFYHFWL